MSHYYTYEGQYVQYQVEYPEVEEIVYEEPAFEYRVEQFKPYKIPLNPSVCYIRKPFPPIQKYTNRSKLYVQLRDECKTRFNREVDDIGDISTVYEEDYNFEEEPPKKGKRNQVRTIQRKRIRRKLKKPNYAKFSTNREISDDQSEEEDFSLISSDGSEVVKVTTSQILDNKPSTGSVKAKFLVDKQSFSLGERDNMKVTQDDSSIQIPETSSRANSLPEAKTRFHSVTNVKSIAEGNTTSGEMLGWRKHSMPDTTTDSTFGLSAVSNDPKRLTGTISSDCCTNITINSDEYREFINQINKIPQMTKENQKDDQNMAKSDSTPPMGIGTLLKSFYDSTNTSTKVPEITLTNKTTIDSKSDFHTSKHVSKKLNKKVCIATRRREMYAKVNPLSEVPLIHIFKWATPDEKPNKYRKKSQEFNGSNTSILFKAFRFLVNLIDTVQSFAYRYALRYILFI